MQDFDFAIVGAGIAGVSAAYHLAPQARVIILEREHVAAYHTTGRSAALHSETYGSAEIRAITVASGHFYRKPPPGFTDHPLLTPRGALIAGRAEQKSDMQKAAADYARLVPSVRWLDPAEALRRQPLLKPEAAAGGAIFEEAEDMDVAAIHGGFLKGARAAGAVLRLDAEVTTLTRKDGKWTIGLRDGEIDRRRQHRQRLGRVGRRRGGTGRRRTGGAGPQAPHRLHRRRASRTRPGASADGHRFRRDLVYQARGRPVPRLARRRDAVAALRRAAGGDGHRRRRRTHRERDARSSIRRIKNKWAGLRSFVADKNLVVGYDPKVEGFFWLAGQGGYGIQTAAAAGRLAASLALGKGMPADIAELGVSEAALSPARFTRR